MPSFESLKGVQKFCLQIRVTGILLIGFSIVEFAVGGTAYGFLSMDNIGGWWGGIPALLLGILSQFCDSRPAIWGILFFSFAAGIIALVALCIDGTHAGAVLNSGCYSTSNIEETYGKPSKLADAYNCPYVASADCICSAYTRTCYAYHLSVGSNCETLFSTYYGELASSSVFNAVLCILCGFQFLFCIINVGNPDAANPSQVTAPQNAPTQPVAPYVVPAQSSGYVSVQMAAAPTAPLPQFEPYYASAPTAPPGNPYPMSYAPGPVSYVPINAYPSDGMAVQMTYDPQQQHMQYAQQQQQMYSDNQEYYQPSYVIADAEVPVAESMAPVEERAVKN